ncbi:phenylacetate--CoA ligase family protein [Chitinivorax sp. B]|uniref:phenylacetate--CoA ligase family protein n=1 Tax=Chitinivorax sp. B TaxID=2502235 RepID=UPI0010F646DE|nr:phenylacetate--CoA ligase family protein [Chitinivorax sp. B]
MTTPLASIVRHARLHAPYYRQLYAHLPESDWQLSDLPLIEPETFWADAADIDHWPVLTGPILDGHVFKTGGSTSEGKLSIYSREEWQQFIHRFGQGLGKQLKAGDRVANLFFAGDLYTSFLFIHGSLSHSPVPVCEFPFTGAVDDATLADAINQYGITVLACVPAQLLRFASWLNQVGRQLPGIRCILYGGESLFDDQRPLLDRVFPNARTASIGCASVDAGLIGASLPDCTSGEHRVFDGDTLVEIIDEATGQPITAMNQVGMLVVTNLQRRLMPILRYPTGDLACWRETVGTPQRKFALCGRASQGHRLRVGTLSLFPAEIGKLIAAHAGHTPWQLHLSRSAGVDTLTLRLADDAGQALPPRAELQTALQITLPALAEALLQGQVIVQVHYLPSSTLATHPRSGKLLRIVDERHYLVTQEEMA